MSDEQVPLHGAHCLHCGDPVKYSAWSINSKMGLHRRADVGKKEAWVHSDSNKRDHQAFPHDLRDPSVDIERQRRSYESAKIGVKRNLGRQFDYLHAQNTVNDIAKGMGL